MDRAALRMESGELIMDRAGLIWMEKESSSWMDLHQGWERRLWIAYNNYQKELAELRMEQGVCFGKKLIQGQET